MEPSFATLVADGWVWPSNVKALATSLSRWVGYPFDDADWTSIDFGLRQTNWDQEVWFAYPLMGVPPLELRLAKEDAADPVGVIIMATRDLPEPLFTRIETTLSIFNSYRLSE